MKVLGARAGFREVSLRGVGTLAACAIVGCVSNDPGQAVTPPAARNVSAATAGDAELAAALDHYDESGDFGRLQAWVEAHPEDPSAVLWREIVALRLYERTVDARLPDDSEAMAQGLTASLAARDSSSLAAVGSAYPETVAGRLALGLVRTEAFTQLRSPTLNPAVVKFLDTTVLPDTGGTPPTAAERETLREQHGHALREAIVSALLSDECRTQVAYCNWWIDRYPEDPRTRTLIEATGELWYRRGHPPWKGRRHANCAYQCANSCRAEAAPLDDGCYAPCFARCP